MPLAGAVAAAVEGWLSGLVGTLGGPEAKEGAAALLSTSEGLGLHAAGSAQTHGLLPEEVEESDCCR